MKHQNPHEIILNNQTKIENWFRAQWETTQAPVYGSIDLRNAGWKCAPIDMNLFPAGFNNLNVDSRTISIEAAKKSIHALAGHVKNILLIPEDHTRNIFYWENIKTLLPILKEANYSVRIGSLSKENTIDDLRIERVQRNEKNQTLTVPDFNPDMILLNNDLSEDIPDILRNISQPILPSPQLGWSLRSKSNYFTFYDKVAEKFAFEFDMDPWLISSFFQMCEPVDFMKRTGEAHLTTKAKLLFTQIEKKYRDYHITEKPYIVIKADAGTYGMAVKIIHDPDEIYTLNRKDRTMMSKSKGGRLVDRVILQEGVYTIDRINGSTAEPVIVSWGEKVVGGFYRTHKKKQSDENLNTPGMHFTPLENNYVYDVITRLSLLAAGFEMKETLK